MTEINAHQIWCGYYFKKQNKKPIQLIAVSMLSIIKITY